MKQPKKLKPGQMLGASEVNERLDDAVDVGKAAGMQQASAMERTRISVILSCSEATGRTDLARHIAFNTAITAEDAKVMLASSPKEDVRAASPFFAAMNAIANPQVGAEVGDLSSMSEDQRASAMAASIVSTYRGASSA